MKSERKFIFVEKCNTNWNEKTITRFSVLYQHVEILCLMIINALGHAINGLELMEVVTIIVITIGPAKNIVLKAREEKYGIFVKCLVIIHHVVSLSNFNPNTSLSYI